MRAIDLADRRYVLQILAELTNGQYGFNELQRKLGINQHTLRLRLKLLESHGIVLCKVRAKPFATVYWLTPIGVELASIANNLQEFELK